MIRVKDAINHRGIWIYRECHIDDNTANILYRVVWSKSSSSLLKSLKDAERLIDDFNSTLIG